MVIKDSVVSAEADNTLQDLHNSSDDTKAEFNNIVLLFTQNINEKVIIMAGQSWSIVRFSLQLDWSDQSVLTNCKHL